MTSAARWVGRGAATAVLATASILGPTVNAPVEAAVAQPRTLVVPTGYPTIQAAVDAATSGDRIVVRSGTFSEQVSVAKDLTITGSGSTVIRAPGSFAVGALGQTSILEVSSGATMHLSNLTVSGPGAGSCEVGALWAGIYAADGATLDAEQIRVTNIRDAQLNPCPRSGNGIVVGDVESPATARIQRSKIDGYQAAGIVVIGPNSRAEVVDNIVQGPGRTPLAATGGIEFVVGATGTAERNIVSGNACGSVDLGCGPDWFEQYQVAGISADGPDTVIRNNLLVGNQVGIYTGPPTLLAGNVMVNNDDVGLALQDGAFAPGKNVVIGGGGGVAVIAASLDTTADLHRIRVVSPSGPARQEFACCGVTATITG